jgi:HEAT repeat protein
MKTAKITPLLAALILFPALFAAAQTAPQGAAKPAVKKMAAKPGAKRPVKKPGAKPGVAVSTGTIKGAKPAVAQKPAAAAVAQSTAAAGTPFDAALQKLSSKDPSLRRQGADALAQLRDQKAAPALLKALGDEAAPVRASAVDGLCQLAYRLATAKIAGILTADKDAIVRQQAASSLSYMSDPSAGPALVKALRDDAMAVRYAAANTLGAMKYAPAEDDLISLLKDQSMRRVAISALGQLQSKKAAPAIFSALSDQDKYTRLEAVRALGAIGDKSAAPELEKKLDKAEDPSVRVESALALARMGSNAGLVTSYEFVKSPDISLKNQAMDVIATVGDNRSLQFIEELYNAEKDPVSKGMLDFTRQRLMARQKMEQQKKP